MTTYQYIQIRPQAIGHFTAMIQDRAGRIGCAASTYRNNQFNVILFACNMSFTNIIEEAVYVFGPTTSSCETGANPLYPGLCSVDEIVSQHDVLIK